MLVHLRRSVILSVILLVLTGLLYPAVVTGISQIFFKQFANGSLTPNGSTLVGQTWSGPTWFHGRADSDVPLGPGVESGAANLGPRSRKLVQSVQTEREALVKLGIKDPTPDLVTSSASGYDPDITPADAYAQVAMISAARQVSSELDGLIKRETHRAEWNFLGSPYIVVLQLNEALAELR